MNGSASPFVLHGFTVQVSYSGTVLDSGYVSPADREGNALPELLSPGQSDSFLVPFPIGGSGTGTAVTNAQYLASQCSASV